MPSIRETARAAARRLPRLRRGREPVGRDPDRPRRHVLRRLRPQSRGAADGAAMYDPDGDRADGPDAPPALQAGDRRGRRLCRRGRARAGAVVRPARGVGEREVRRVLPALGRAADRRRHGAPAAPDRPQPRARHDPDRPRGRRARGFDWGLANRLVPEGQALAEARALAAEIARFPSLCMRSDPCPPTGSGTSTSPKRFARRGLRARRRFARAPAPARNASLLASGARAGSTRCRVETDHLCARDKGRFRAGQGASARDSSAIPQSSNAAMHEIPPCPFGVAA